MILDRHGVEHIANVYCLTESDIFDINEDVFY